MVIELGSAFHAEGRHSQVFKVWGKRQSFEVLHAIGLGLLLFDVPFVFDFRLDVLNGRF